MTIQDSGEVSHFTSGPLKVVPRHSTHRILLVLFFSGENLEDVDRDYNENLVHMVQSNVNKYCFQKQQIINKRHAYVISISMFFYGFVH